MVFPILPFSFGPQQIQNKTNKKPLDSQRSKITLTNIVNKQNKVYDLLCPLIDIDEGLFHSKFYFICEVLVLSVNNVRFKSHLMTLMETCFAFCKGKS